MTAAALLARIDANLNLCRLPETADTADPAIALIAVHGTALRALRVAVEALERTDSPRTRPNLSSDALAEIARLLEVHDG